MGAGRATDRATGRRALEYPESDGKPMAETDLHRDEMFDLIARLKQRFDAERDVYVSGNLLLYYEEGNPRASVSPDVFVVRGVAKERRRVYKLWEEGRPPCVVIEVTSRKTKGEDLRSKKALYARLGVAEYFLYDPDGEYLAPPLLGHRLGVSGYESIAPDATGGLRSEELGLDLRLQGGRLELYDPEGGERLRRWWEETEAGHRRAEAERRRAEAERRRTEAERRRAEAERRRAEAAEAEIARLRAQLGPNNARP